MCVRVCLGSTTLPERYSVTRNFVFLPWDESYTYRDDGQRLHLESPHGPSPWTVEEPSRFLYCHQKTNSRNDFKGQTRIYNNQFEYINSDRYPANMQVRACVGGEAVRCACFQHSRCCVVCICVRQRGACLLYTSDAADE